MFEILKRNMTDFLWIKRAIHAGLLVLGISVGWTGGCSLVADFPDKKEESDPQCGNGVREGDEACDFGQENSDDTPNACREDCTLPVCGDGVTDDASPYGEECDDGNLMDGDGCSAQCGHEGGPYCGDGVVDDEPPYDEACDDGAANSNDTPNACREDCTLPSCGDGVVDDGSPYDEACDDGAANSNETPNACRADCTLPSCGDGVVDDESPYDETCDDNNNIEGDGCSPECQIEPCGDGLCDVTDETVENCPQDCAWAEISAGNLHTCALKVDGTIWCWGDNAYQQFGVGNAYQSGSAYPVKVDDLEDAIALSAGDNYTCAVEGTDGYCWGSGQAGQLGNGNNQMEGTPASVFSGALKVVAGNWHTCAITLQGQISCWGANVYGQIGNGTTTDSNSPVPVSLGWTAVDVTARWNHSCAAHQDGTVYCWGWNRYGQLGRGDLLDQLSPKPASGTILNEVVVQVAAGMHHTCALDQDGGVWCWGRNNYGQIGDPYAQQDQCGSDVECVLEPHRVPYQPSGVVSSIAVGHDHTCALSQDTMYCWGKNWHGQLGDGQGGPGAEEKQPKPVTQNNPAFVSITAGGEHTCAIDGEGKAYCWGQNEQDQVGGTADATQLVPFAVPDPSP